MNFKYAISAYNYNFIAYDCAAAKHEPAAIKPTYDCAAAAKLPATGPNELNPISGSKGAAKGAHIMTSPPTLATITHAKQPILFLIITQNEK